MFSKTYPIPGRTRVSGVFCDGFRSSVSSREYNVIAMFAILVTSGSVDLRLDANGYDEA